MLWTPGVIIALVILVLATLGLTVICVSRAVIPFYFNIKLNYITQYTKLLGQAVEAVAPAVASMAKKKDE